MKIEVKQISEEKHPKKKVSVKTAAKKIPVDTVNTLESATKPPEPKPPELAPGRPEPVVTKRSFEPQKKYQRALIPRIPTPKITDISLLGRVVVLVAAATLIVIGGQSLLVEYDNKIWNVILTPFNVAIIILGLILITLYIPKKYTHKSIR